MHVGEQVAKGYRLYEAVAQAPAVWVTHVPRHRDINGRIVTGSWSDPWWMFCDIGGWAIARRWKSKRVHGWLSQPAIPALDEIVIESVDMSVLLRNGMQPISEDQ